MARPVGTPLTSGLMRLHIPEDWVLKQGRHRFVYAEVLSPRIHQVSLQSGGSNKIYHRFIQAVGRELYNQKAMHGLRAIDIDQPQREGIAVSVRLEIIVGEGEDSFEQV
jgi:hypothetical protein